MNGLWSFGATEEVACTTGVSGICFVSRSNLQNIVSSVTFIVGSLGLAGRVYAPSANHDQDGDSYRGMAIIVYRKPQFLVYLPYLDK